MKRKILAMGGVLAIVAASGAAWLMLAGSGEPKTLAAYWDGAAEINAADKSGRLPLVMAVEAGDEAAAKYLIEQGADTDRADRNGVSALAAAAARGDFSLFEAVAAASKADLKAPQLMDKALDGGNVKIVKLLLEKGSDANAVLVFKGKHKPEEMPDYKDPRVITPLKKAVAAGRADIAAVLLDKGADGAAYFLAENVRTAAPELVRALGDQAGDLREIETGNTDLLTYAAEMAPAGTLAYLIEKNAGDVNAALQRVLTHRKDAERTGAKAENGAAGAMSGTGGAERTAGTENGANAAEKNPSETAQIIELFLQNGARPTVAAMELMLAERRTDAYLALAQCSPNSNALTAKNESMLMYAVENGYVDGVRFLLEQGADMWQAEADGRTVIGTAVKNAAKHPEVVALLEERLKDINEPGYNGETLLMLYAGSGRDADFARVAEKGGDIFKVDNAGKTLLMYAAEGGNTKIVDYLLNKGANIAAKDNAGRTALMYAAGSGRDAAARLLAEKGAKTGEADYEGKTVLMYAAEKGSPETAARLIDDGISFAAADNEGRTALMYAAGSGNVPMAEMLLEKGDDVDKTDVRGRTALAYAAKNGNAEIIRLIRDYGADIYLADKDGKQPVVYAIEQGNAEAFDLLTDGFMLFGSAVGRNGKTVLMYAIEGGNVQILRKVMDRGLTTLNKKDRFGRTALMYLVGEGRPDMVRELIQKGANVTARDNNGKTVLMYAAEGTAGVNMVTVLQNFWVDANTNINMRDSDGKTALMYAVSGKNSQLIKPHMLLARNANADATDDTGKTVLMYAVGNHEARVDAKAIEELLAAVKRIDQNDDNGRTALMYAAANPTADMGILEQLIEKGANVQAADNTGKTALMYAAEGGDIGKVRLLLAAGANASVQTQDGKTAADFAKGNGKCFADAVRKLLK